MVILHCPTAVWPACVPYMSRMVSKKICLGAKKCVVRVSQDVMLGTESHLRGLSTSALCIAQKQLFLNGFVMSTSKYSHLSDCIKCVLTMCRYFLLLPCTCNRLLLTLVEIASAMAYLHHMGIVHCDIKPGNVRAPLSPVSFSPLEPSCKCSLSFFNLCLFFSICLPFCPLSPSLKIPEDVLCPFAICSFVFHHSAFSFASQA